MPLRRNEPIASWQSGDAVQGFALLARKELRQDRNARPYLDMELADASGSIAAKVWGDNPALEGDFEAHQFVAFKGLVKLYRDALQLSIDECRVATEEDRQFGFDEDRLIPTTREDVDDLWRRLERIYPGAIRRPPLARLAAETLAEHGAALREHPAAKTLHHAYRGGLLEHVVSMAELAERICDHYPDLDRDLVLVGVLFHDLGKLRELGAMPANDYTVEGRLVGHVVLGRDLLLARAAAIAGFPADLRLQLEHLVLSHQGRREFGSPAEPMTAEAVVLHFIDDLDAKLNQLRLGRDRTEGLQYLKGFGRYLYLGGLTAGEDDGPAGEAAPPQASPAPDEAAPPPPEPAVPDDETPTTEPPQAGLF
jgi:3'-5' exoribonuclease